MPTVQGPERAAPRRGGPVLALTLALVLALVAGCTGPAPSGAVPAGGSAGAPDRGTHVTTTAGRVEDREVEAALGALLRERSRALAADDRETWAGTVAAPDSVDGRRELAAFTTLRALGVSGFDIEGIAALPVGAAGTGSAAGVGAAGTGSAADTVRRAAVRLGYAVPGIDRAARSIVRTVSLVGAPGRWRIASWLGPQDPGEVFDLPEALVVRTGRVVLVGTVPLVELLARAADAEHAQSVVAAGLAQPPAPALLVVPATTAQAAWLVGRSDPGSMTSVAATTIGRRDPGQAAPADRVVLNPQALARLTDTGRRVVLAHELVHVTLRATTGHDLPVWLSEGVAEWVAFGPVDLPVTVVAAHLLAQVRAVGPPARLPTGADVDPGGADAVAAYQGAWLAVGRLARERGREAVLALVRALAGTPGDGRTGPPDRMPAETFARIVGQTEEQFTAGWRAELVALARPAPTAADRGARAPR